MIIKLIHNNKIGAYTFMLLFLIILWIKPLVVAPVNVLAFIPKMPLWGMFSFTAVSPSISLLFSFICTVIISLNLTRMGAKYALFSKQSALPGFIFIMIAGSIQETQYFNPIWISTILLLVSLEYIFGAYNLRKTMKECFIASFLFSLSSLFAFKTLLLIPLLLLLMIPLRVLSFKSLLATIIGLTTPWLFVLGYELLTGNVGHFLSYFAFTSERFFGFYNHSTYSLVFFCILLLMFFPALMSVVNQYGKKKIFTRKQYQTSVIISIYLIVLMVITGTSIEFITLLAVPLAILFSHLIDNAKSWIWQNVAFACLLVCVIIGQIFL